MLEKSRPSGRRKRLATAGLISVLALGSMVGVASAKPSKSIEYRFVFTNGVVVEGTTTDKTVMLTEAGGDKPGQPAGMEVHVSCSDKFEDGWGKKGGPDPDIDSAWQVASFGILKGKKSCGDVDPATGLQWTGTKTNKKTKNIEFRFEFENGEVIQGTAEANTVFVASAGGPSIDDPTGMEMHVSCSDTYEDGWGEKGGPIEGVDTAWKILDWGIRKDGDKTCGHVDPLSGGEFEAVAGDDDDGKDKKTKEQKADTKSKVINYSFLFENGTHIEGVATANTVFIPEVGGESTIDPTGMDMHVSCSDDYSDGWGAKGGPIPDVDTAWKIAEWFITKGDKTCGDPFVPPTSLSGDADDQN